MLGLYQRLSMNQTLAPQQVMLSTILQLQVLSLEQRINTELEMNPLLEEEEEEIREIPEEDLQEKEEKEIDDDAEIDWEKLGNDDDDYVPPRLGKDKNIEEFDRPEPAKVTLAQHLLEQFYLLTLTQEQITIGEFIINSLDDTGYFTLPFEVLVDKLNVHFESIEETLKLVQSLEPKGIAARNLQECLLIQVKKSEIKLNPNCAEILENYFDDFKNRRLEKIAKDLDAPLEVILDAVEQIKKLNPKPGEGEFESKFNYIVPDFLVEAKDGDFLITINDYNIPALKISPTYEKMYHDKKKVDKKTREYIKERMEKAKWFIACIYERKRTMTRVMAAIINRQRIFFEKGDPDLIQPMRLKDVAEDIEMDISTISRSTSGKYVQTDFGTFELKYFFGEGLETEDGENISTRKIKSRIAEMIGKENKSKPLSDDVISKKLKAEGYNVARRTVNKYREQLNISVARLRKEF
ncbi:RNA polymerase factor sigma-54 [bacterium]|nr:RNA polymerase factor sigma-54 [bacterium]